MKLRLVALGGAVLLSACASVGVPVAPPSGVSNRAATSFQPTCPGGSLRGEGASSQKTTVEMLVQDYVAACPGTTIDYTASGSGAGIKAFFGGTIDWAGSDAALLTTEKDGVIETDRARLRCGGNDAWNLPLVFGPIAFVYNLEGIDDLNLTPPLIAKIFDGQITVWNDPEIAAQNPGADLPAEEIAVFYRADESGTTESLTTYLAAAAEGAWPYAPAKKWPTAHGEGKEKTAGVADSVAATGNSITYVEWGAALERDLQIARLNGVELTGDAAAAAVAEAEQQGEGNDLRLGLDYTAGDGTYPAVMVTYAVVCSAGGSNPQLVRDFLGLFAAAESQAALEELGYAPLPEQLRNKVAEAIAEIS
ncbi:MAG: phosphate ABC transporter substrate-binding protein PstS [Propionibacteriaceae bacterium]|nr:phosphate ABC transporter substrate-binding protein PstS [Propionibacteriaceae bacterium]